MKKKFNLEESIDLEGLSLSEDEKYDIRQYIKNILLKPKRMDCPDCQGTGNFYRNDQDGDFLKCDTCLGTGDGYHVRANIVDVKPDKVQDIVPKKSCNRHDDCNKAQIEKFGKIDYYPNFHCHDDECEDCFGR